MRIILAISFLFLLACASEEIRTPEEKPVSEKSKSISKPSTKKDMYFDIRKLQSGLGMFRNASELGFDEISFNPCEHGLSTASGDGCNRQMLSVVHFRLRCRDSEGTVEYVSNAELVPVVSDRIQWWLGDNSGFTSTDGKGYGQIVTVSVSSVRSKRLALKIGGNSLGLQASQVKQVVVPRDWCIESNSI